MINYFFYGNIMNYFVTRNKITNFTSIDAIICWTIFYRYTRFPKLQKKKTRKTKKSQLRFNFTRVGGTKISDRS